MTTRCARCGLEILPHEPSDGRPVPAHKLRDRCIDRLRGALDYSEDLGGDLHRLIVGAVRYALGRRTYVVSDTCDVVRRQWRAMDRKSREVVARDVREALYDVDRVGGRLGDACDDKCWRELLAWMEGQS